MNNLDRKTAKERFTISKHKDTYEITGFSNVGYRQGTWGKGSGYEYYFYDDKTSREITIPDEIDGLPVLWLHLPAKQIHKLTGPLDNPPAPRQTSFRQSPTKKEFFRLPLRNNNLLPFQKQPRFHSPFRQYQS